ncbi:MAG: hypothetical protein M1399_03225, partial [Actinobacteria bacterium]|nr:hypothetical protein [Actinomycetota bacterium]MCL5446420.1 hypothetical protein [Actinomycetota bacterium]
MALADNERERFSHGKALSEILISLWSYLAMSSRALLCMDVPGRKILRGNHRLYSAKRLVA